MRQLYERPVTLSKSRSRCQTPVRNLQPLHLQNHDRELKLGIYVYQRPLTLSMSISGCQTPVRNLQPWEYWAFGVMGLCWIICVSIAISKQVNNSGSGRAVFLKSSGQFLVMFLHYIPIVLNFIVCLSVCLLTYCLDEIRLKI